MAEWSMDRWFKAHKYPWIKTANGTYYWETFIQTGELTPEGKIIWHEKELFKKIKKTLDKHRQKVVYYNHKMKGDNTNE